MVDFCEKDVLVGIVVSGWMFYVIGVLEYVNLLGVIMVFIVSNVGCVML